MVQLLNPKSRYFHVSSSHRGGSRVVHSQGGLEMSSSSVGQQRSSASQSGRAQSTGRSSMLMRLSSETKHAFKTTEFWAMCAIVAGILIASYVIGQDDGNGNPDVDAFPAS